VTRSTGKCISVTRSTGFWLWVWNAVQGQHMKQKNADGVGDYDDAFSPVPAASSFRTILSLAIQLDILINKMIITYIH